MRSIYYLFIICFFGCATGSEDKKSTDTVEATEVLSQTKVAYDFPVYNSFDDIEYIFKYKNDTTYVINFWATWCKPCVAELPYFEQLNLEMAEEKVRVILVSLDFKKQIDTKLVPFLKNRNIQSEVMLLLDDKAVNWIDRVDEAWSGAIPATVFYNKEYWEFVEGEFESYEDIKSIVNSYLN